MSHFVLLGAPTAERQAEATVCKLVSFNARLSRLLQRAEARSEIEEELHAGA